MLLEHDLREELAESLDIDELNHVHLPCKALGSLVMALQPLHSPLEPLLLFAASLAQAAHEQVRQDVLNVAVEIFALPSHIAHHFGLCFVSILWRQDVCVATTW